MDEFLDVNWNVQKSVVLWTLIYRAAPVEQHLRCRCAYFSYPRDVWGITFDVRERWKEIAVKPRAAKFRHRSVAR